MTSSPLFESPPTFSSLQVGDTFSGRLTVTESHLVLATGIFADFSPVYTDEESAKTTRVGTRVVPGSLIAGIMAGVLGKALGRSLLGVLDQHVRFLAPVVPGTTLATEWVVLEKIETPDAGLGIATCQATCASEPGTVVAEQDLKIEVAY